MNSRQRRFHRRLVKRLKAEMHARIEASPLVAKIKANMHGDRATLRWSSP